MLVITTKLNLIIYFFSPSIPSCNKLQHNVKLFNTCSYHRANDREGVSCKSANKTCNISPIDNVTSAASRFFYSNNDMASKVPSITLNNGLKIPVLGLGTWKSKPGEVENAVKDAIDVGYRHFDCAHVYQNEKEVGEALKQKIQEGVVKRQDLWITSKLWNTFHSPNLVEPAIRTTLNNLGLEYLDLYLIHWPMGFQEGGDLFPIKGNQMLYSDVDYVDTWKAMEKLVEKGLTKSIGLSNFNPEQIERILKVAKIKPVINQVEVHPYLNEKKLGEFARQRGIYLTAYSPLGSPDRPWAKPDDPQLLQDPKLLAIAKRHNKSPAQICIRFQIQLGNTVIPKSVTKSRIAENFQVFDFELTKEDMAELESFDCNGRVCFSPQWLSHPYCPFKISH